jgi:hypothetical protein
MAQRFSDGAVTYALPMAGLRLQSTQLSKVMTDSGLSMWLCESTIAWLARLSRSSAIAPDVVVLHDVHEVDRAAFPPKHDPITAADSTLEIVLIRKDGLHVETRRVGSLDQSHGDAIPRGLTVGCQPCIAVPPLVGPDGGTDGGPGRQAPATAAACAVGP